MIRWPEADDFEGPAAPTAVPGPAVSLLYLRGELGRRRRIWVALALVGLLLGAGYHHLVPRKYVATSLVTLAYTTNGIGVSDIATDALVAQSEPVASAAAKSIGYGGSAQSFAKLYTVNALSSSLMSISATTHSATSAERTANAVAKQLLAFRAQQLRSLTDTNVTQLKQRAADLSARLDELNRELDHRGTAPGLNIDQAIAERSQDTTELQTVQGEISGDELAVGVTDSGSHLINSAITEPHSALKLTLGNALIGAVAGGGLGILIVLLGAVVSDRLRRRDDVARALGVPVMVSTPRRLLPARRTAALEPAIDWLVQLGRTEGLRRGGLTLIDIDSGSTVRLLAEEVAKRLSTTGRGVVVSRHNGSVAAENGNHANGHRNSGPATVSVVSPDLGSVPAAGELTGSAVLVVTAGKSSADKLRGIGRLLRHAGIKPAGAVLLRADQQDQSIGLLDEPMSAPAEGTRVDVVGS